MPDISNPNNYPFSVYIILGNAFKFVLFHDNTFEITPKLKSYVGRYSIKLILADETEDPTYTTYSFNIIVTNGTKIEN